jgi:hypothetical protein
MSLLTQIKRPLKLKMPYSSTYVIVRVSATAIVDGVTTTSDPNGSLMVDTTVPSLFIANAGVWVALATQSATPTFTGGTATNMSLVTPTVKDLTEVVTATNVIAASETGSTFFLNSATEFVSTLPAPAAGLRFRFIVTAAPAGASYTIVTTGAAQIMGGHVHSAASAAGDVETPAAGTTLTFVDGQAVAGDWAEFISDGTSWYCVVFTAVDAGATITG